MDPNVAIPRMYDAVVDPTRWPGVLETLIAVANCDAAVLHRVDPTRNRYDACHVAGSLASATSAARNRYKEIARLDQIWQPLAACRAGQVVRDAGPDLTASELRNSEIGLWLESTARLLRRFSIRLGTASQGAFDAITLYFSADQIEIPESSIAAVKQLIPHLLSAHRHSCDSEALANRHSLIIDVFNRVEFGLAIADGSRRVLACNDFAREMFELIDGVSLGDDDILRCADQRVHELVSEAMERLLSDPATGDGSDDALVVLPATNPTQSVVLGIAPHNAAHRGLVMLTLIESAAARSIDIAPIARVYDLSNAETEIARYVVIGLTNPEIAEQRDVAQQTIKSQVANVLHKTGCKRRTELVRLAIHLASPLRSAV